jgi:CRP/FNR family transcriptional regulator
MSVIRAVVSDEEPFHQHPLLNGISRERVEAVVGTLRPLTIAAGQLVPGSGPNGQDVHLILAGLLRAFELTADGREALVDLIGPGDLEGFAGFASRSARFLQTLEDSVILSINQEQLTRLAEDAAFATRLTEYLLTVIRYREDQLRLTSIREPARRLALMLTMLADRFGRPIQGSVSIDFRLTHQTIADMLGFRRETVTHALHQLAATGGLRLEPGRMVVDRQMLARLALRSARVDGKGQVQAYL